MAGITLAQLAQLEKEPLRAGIIKNIIRDVPLLDTFPFQTIDSLKSVAVRWEKLPTALAWRQLNAGYSSAEDGQVGEVWESLYGFGGDITYDSVIDQTKNYIQDPVQLQIKMKLKVLAYGWLDCLINGDHATNADQFEGLKKRVAGMPTRQTIYAAASTSAGLDVTGSAGNCRTFLNKLDECWYKCQGGPGMVLTNEAMKWGFLTALRYSQTLGNFLDTTKDVIGRDILTFKGVPLYDVGLQRDQTTEIVTVTETGGTGTANTTSMYFVSFDGDQGVTGIQLSEPKIYDPLSGAEMESKPSKMLRLDWWNGIASFGSNGITRMRNVLDPASWTA